MIDDPFSDLLKTNKRKENISKLNDDLAYEILSVVEEIPAGRVATYGQIAKLIGREKNFRLVARVLSHAENYGKFPCHRVVNHMGRLAPGWTEQEWLLKGEGVTLKENGCVDLKKYLWEC
ncbi:MGMT family protein [Ruminococcus sp. Marseille-P328]|jgi:methylated-DNA-protein-cysteine methyltransferase-like protein|uniref:MGMT family protein n=1 Tax=Ruminococcus sp. Marseille-P328 TaxID=1816688 RepID=UPI0015B59833